MEGKRLQRLPVWLIGESGHPDFAAATAWLMQHFACTIAGDFERADDTPSAFVFFQSRPGSISPRQVATLHRRAPFARLVLLTGPWCDGAFHSSRLALGVVRIRWHEWRERLPAELGSLRSHLPRTATDGERLEGQIRELTHSLPSTGRAAICTANRAKYEALAAACGALGWQANWLSSPDQIARDCDLLLIDGWECVVDRVSPNDSSPRLLLLGFPRPDDCQRATDIGIAAVIAEPLMLPSLAAALSVAVPPSLHHSVA
jgi:hypothetical protein